MFHHVGPSLRLALGTHGWTSEMPVPMSRPSLPRCNAAGAADLSISADLVEPFYRITCEYFAHFNDVGSDGGATADFFEQVFDLCRAHDDEHGSNKFNLLLRVEALIGMKQAGVAQTTPPQLWQVNAFNVTVPAARLIRAALTLPWPAMDAIAAQPDDPTPIRQAWVQLVDRCVASALGPSGAGNPGNSISSHLH